MLEEKPLHVDKCKFTHRNLHKKRQKPGLVALRCGGRRIRNSKLAPAKEQVRGQPRLCVTLPQKGQIFSKLLSEDSKVTAYSGNLENYKIGFQFTNIICRVITVPRKGQKWSFREKLSI